MPKLLLQAALLASRATAQIFNGPGLEGGVAEAGMINGPAQAPLRVVIMTMVYNVLTFLGLAALVMVVAAGIYLIVGGGSDGSKDTAKKIILYVAIGLLIILFARSFIGFFLNGSFL